jgi:CheY-like chemotaxis protein
MLIAVIDDEPAILDYARVVLEEAGYSVAVWRTEDGAHSFVAEIMPAALLLDVQMERRDAGLRVLRAIRSDPRTRAIPIVLSTGLKRLTSEQVAQIEDLDYHFLPKPYTADTLIAAVAHGIGMSTGNLPR